MPPSEDDPIRLQHMLDYTQKALRFSNGKTRADLEQDEQLMLALVRAVEVIGEAASKTSANLQERTPSIPWAEIISTRNRLVHAYFSVDLDVLWAIITEDLPLLVIELQMVIDNVKRQRNFF
ncbi:MAG: DUF86 domain-containing protein [Ignavibacteriae bacterium]|nr:DUF86 domain-containing protein [Ignavibacteriota bacterium]